MSARRVGWLAVSVALAHIAVAQSFLLACPVMTAAMDMAEASEGTDRSTYMSARMSARTQRIEVITRGERRRRWSASEQQAIVAENLEPNVSIAGIARKHGIGTGQLYGWRHQFLANRADKTTGFAPVALLREPRRLAGPIALSPSLCAKAWTAWRCWRSRC